MNFFKTYVDILVLGFWGLGNVLAMKQINEILALTNCAIVSKKSRSTFPISTESSIWVTR